MSEKGTLEDVMPKLAIRSEKDGRIFYSVEKTTKAAGGAQYFPRDVIGYVELPRHTRTPHVETFEEFLDEVEELSEYQTWFADRLTDEERAVRRGDGSERGDGDV